MFRVSVPKVGLIISFIFKLTKLSVLFMHYISRVSHFFSHYNNQIRRIRRYYVTKKNSRPLRNNTARPLFTRSAHAKYRYTRRH